MKRLIIFVTKYWVVLSVITTVLMSILSFGWRFYNRLDADEDKINATNAWVSSHDDSINDLQTDVNRLKEDRRLQELGICK